MKDRRTAVQAVHLILKRNYEILVARRANTGYQDGMYNFPSGHVEPGESPTRAIMREAREEVGVTLSADNLEFVHVLHRPNHDGTGERVNFFFRSYVWEGTVTNLEPGKCDNLLWARPSELPDNMTAHEKHVVECIEARIFYSELGVEFLKKHGLWTLPE